jgi:hypothetical protein
MTHLTAASHESTPGAAIGASSASRGDVPLALLASDDIVRPELRNAAILRAKRVSPDTRHAARSGHTPARRS